MSSEHLLEVTDLVMEFPVRGGGVIRVKGPLEFLRHPQVNE